MIDIHSHFVPSVDDGSPDLETTETMLKMAASDGITDIVSTSHLQMYSDYIYGDAYKTIFHSIKGIAKECGINIHLGNELFYSDDLIRKIDELDYHTLAGSRYVLLEFDFLNVPDDIESIVNEFEARKLKVIIAHPERYPFFQEDFQRIGKLIDAGAYLQINASSIKGRSGKSAKELASFLLKNRIADFVATDSHEDISRKPLLSETFRYISEKYSEDYARKVIIDNPKAVLEDRIVEKTWGMPKRQKKGLLGRILGSNK